MSPDILVLLDIFFLQSLLFGTIHRCIVFSEMCVNNIKNIFTFDFGSNFLGILFSPVCNVIIKAF